MGNEWFVQKLYTPLCNSVLVNSVKIWYTVLPHKDLMGKIYFIIQ